MAIQKSTIGKKVADFALITYVDHLDINKEQASELIELLTERYAVRSQRGLHVILERVKDALCYRIPTDDINSDIDMAIGACNSCYR